MRICMVTKYPPIEGGVSAQNYWTARALAEAGHEVHVVTNATEVEPGFRIHLSREDADMLEPRAASGGFVKIIGTPPTSRRYFHVPWSNPFTSKLAGLVAQTVREHDCEVIYSYYLEPYGVAAHLAARWTDTPYIVRHAGSDYGRLMEIPELRATYREVLAAADVVVSHVDKITELTALGVRPDAVFTGARSGVAPDVFAPDAPPLDVRRIADEFETSLPTGMRSDGRSGASALDPPPAIGVYGKVGEIKGTSDLTGALGVLAREGLGFEFIALTHGLADREERFLRAVADEGLEGRTWNLPFLAPWRIPSLIRACTAVCFLERDFPIRMHSPIVPREVLACGTCLIVSLEIAAKQHFRERLIHGRNVLVVRDPRDVAELSELLRDVVSKPERARAVGARGREVSEAVEDFAGFTATCERMLQLAIANHRTPSPVGRRATRLSRAIALVRARLPWTAWLLGDDLELWLKRFLEQQPSEDRDRDDAPAAFAGFLSATLPTSDTVPPYATDVLRYDIAGLAESEPADAAIAAPMLFRASREGSGKGGALDGEVDDLRPRLFENVRLENFDYDLSEFAAAFDEGRPVREVARQASAILFLGTATRSHPRTFTLSDHAAAVVAMIDGQRTVRSLCNAAVEHFDAGTPATRDQVTTLTRHLLDRLFEEGLIGFAD
jgi:glycosyltransferase involved in cell wall biosynthesis